MITKYGNTSKNSRGYWRIISKKEGNLGKLLHRLIARDYFGNWIDNPNDYFIIHHIDGNPSNNCVLNLVPIKKNEHSQLHNKNKKMSEETKNKISKTRIKNGKSKGKNNPLYGKKRTKKEMEGITKAKIKTSLFYNYGYGGVIFLMHMKHLGYSQKEIIKYVGKTSESFISQYLSRRGLKYLKL